MSDPDFSPNYDAQPSLDGAEANEADVIEQNRGDLSQTPEDVDEGGAPYGYGDEAATELDDANDDEPDTDDEPGTDYDDVE